MKPLLFLGLLFGLLAGLELAALETDFYRLRINGMPAGHMQIRTSEDPQSREVKTEEESTMRLRRLGTTMEMWSLHQSVETGDGRALSILAESRDKGSSSRTSARFDAAARLLEITTQDVADKGRTTRRTEPVPAGMAYTHAQKLAMLKGKPWRPGSAFVFTSYSLDVFGCETLKLVCRGQEEVLLPGGARPAWAFDVVSAIGSSVFPGTMWLDDDCRLLKSQMRFGAILQELEWCTEKQAKELEGAVELTQNMVLKSPELLSLRDLVRGGMRYELSKADGEFPVDASPSPVQVLTPLGANRWAIEVRHLQPKKRMVWPYTGDDPEAKANLASTSTLQLDNPRLRPLAEQAAGKPFGDNAYAAARRIAQFVHRYIENKNYESGYATASEIVESRSGDCTEHSVLVVALCRVLGIPARPVVGLGYTRQELSAGLEGGYFVGHQWAEVWIEGQWYPLDAAMPSGFDAGHIRFIVGDGSDADVLKMLQVLSLLNGLKMEKAEKLAPPAGGSSKPAVAGKRLAESSSSIWAEGPEAEGEASPGLAELAVVPGAARPPPADPGTVLLAPDGDDWQFAATVGAGVTLGSGSQGFGGASVLAHRQFGDGLSLGIGFGAASCPWGYYGPYLPGIPY